MINEAANDARLQMHCGCGQAKLLLCDSCAECQAGGHHDDIVGARGDDLVHLAKGAFLAKGDDDRLKRLFRKLGPETAGAL